MIVITAQSDNDISVIWDKYINCATSCLLLHLVCGVAEPFAARTSEQCANWVHFSNTILHLGADGPGGAVIRALDSLLGDSRHKSCYGRSEPWTSFCLPLVSVTVNLRYETACLCELLVFWCYYYVAECFVNRYCFDCEGLPRRV